VSLVLGGMIIGWARAHGTIILPLLGVLEPWQLVMLVTGIPGLVISGLAFLITEPTPAAPKTESVVPKPRLWEQLKRHRTFYICHFAGFSALGVLAQGWNAWSPAFLGRTLGWKTPQIGATLGILLIIGGFTGQLAGAALADLLFRRGMRDAHLRIYVLGGLVAGLSGVTATLAAMAGRISLMFGALIVLYAAISFLAVAAAALQIATPANMRGRISTLFLMTYNIVGYGLGPVAVALIAQYVYKGDNLGMGLAWNFAIFGALSALILSFGLKAYLKTMDSNLSAPD
jgi:MFS family permease